MFVVAALYKFASLPEYASMRGPLLSHCLAGNIRGTLLLAAEGINGTVAGSRVDIDRLLSYLRSFPALASLSHKESQAHEQPFHRMKVRLRQEIVTLGVPGIDPNRQVGQYVDPKDWNRLISDPEVLVVDTRNHYEYRLGTFQRAVDPHTRAFTEFPDWVQREMSPQQHRRVAMFCTGGIRCEKATSYMLAQGYQEVYHLNGGILKYLEEIPENESLWQGECFVFDHRVTVKHGLEEGSAVMCHACGEPLTPEEQALPSYVPGIACVYCAERLTPDRAQRLSERQRQVAMHKARGSEHFGPHPAHSAKLEVD